MKPETIKAIESILSKGDRAEVIPTKDGEKVVRIRREVVTGKNLNPNPNYVPPRCGSKTEWYRTKPGKTKMVGPDGKLNI